MIDDVLSKLSKVRRHGQGRWVACCPVHDDKTPSLSIRDDNGTILIHCFGCGASGVDVCGAIGVDVNALFPDSDYSEYTVADYKKNAGKRSGLSAAQVLASLRFNVMFVGVHLLRIKKRLEIGEEDTDRFDHAIYAIMAAHEYIQRNYE